MLLKKLLHCILITQIEFFMCSAYDVRVTLCPQLTINGRAYETGVTSHIYPGVFFHLILL